MRGRPWPRAIPGQPMIPGAPGWVGSPEQRTWFVRRIARAMDIPIALIHSVGVEAGYAALSMKEFERALRS